MAQKTTLSPTATPGRTYTFIDKLIPGTGSVVELADRAAYVVELTDQAAYLVELTDQEE